MKLISKHWIIISGVAILLTACNQSDQTKSEDKSQTMIDKSEIEEGLKDLSNPLPQPFEVYTMLEDIGARYLRDIMNPVSNVDNYVSAKSKALNAGVYAADLGYATIYANQDNQDDVNVYSKTLKTLVDDLGVKLDYAGLLENVNDDSEISKDTLVSIVSSIYYDAYTFLYRESESSLAALMAVGAWTEGMYIAANISDDAFQNTSIVKIIFQQSSSLAGLIDFVGNFKDDELISMLLADLEALKTQFDATDGSLSEQQFAEINTSIKKLRASILL
ncbi:MAG: hypothetical protein JW801_08555 [Bacteroidales bacterium]|nr:hypothetical protein [Bacteroidales bacterium]